MEKYKLIACDLDGTFVDSKGRVSEENINAIRRLKKKGIEFIPCTGRTLCEMKEIAAYPEIRYIIYSNGVVIADKEENKNIITGIEGETLKFLLDTCFSFDAYIVFHNNGQTYCDYYLKEKWDEYNVPVEVKRLADFAIYEKDLRNMAYGCTEAECVCIYFRSNEDCEKCRKLLEKNEDLKIVDCYYANLEIFSVKAGKGPALEKLAEILGVPLSQTIGMGDSGNDISLVKTAGLGLAVGNACGELKEIADEVICSNDCHAIRYVEEKYI